MTEQVPFRSQAAFEPLPFRPPNAPDIRTFAVAQMAVAMLSDRSTPGRPFREMRVSVGATTSGSFVPAMTFASDTPDVAEAVLSGEIDLGVFNPSAYLTMAYRGLGPFPKPLPILALGVMPSLDWEVFAVSERFGISSVAEIGERKLPLRVSVRANPTNPTRFVVDEVLGAYGFSLADIESWGGSLQVGEGPRDPARIQELRAGTLDAIFDEGINGWGHIAMQQGMRFLQVGAAAEKRMADLGWGLIPVSRTDFPELKEDLIAVSFSGWPMFTRANLPDDLAYHMARALEAARSLVEWDSASKIELRDLCVSSDACPLDIPLHPGAERYYREKGAL